MIKIMSSQANEIEIYLSVLGITISTAAVQSNFYDFLFIARLNTSSKLYKLEKYIFERLCLILKQVPILEYYETAFQKRGRNSVNDEAKIIHSYKIIQWYYSNTNHSIK